MDTQNTETNPGEQEVIVENKTQGAVEGVSFPDFPETESTKSNDSIFSDVLLHHTATFVPLGV